MNAYKKYKIVILFLCGVIFLQWMFIFFKIAPRKLPVPAAAKKGSIAIVIDDWGYNLNNLHLIEQLKFPFTASVLPNLTFSQEIAQALHNQGVEIILHLPMEPHEKYRLEQKTILTSMDQTAITIILENDLSGIPYLKGVSNHMGSKVTEDIRAMNIIFDDLLKHKLYFLDSFVSSRSVCKKLAKKKRLSFAQRDIFLDNKDDSENIKQQIRKLKKIAVLRGYAVGIGHDRKTTLEVLKEVVPELEKEGFTLVYLSSLVR